MTEHDWVMLGSRAVACKGWRWMPGIKINKTMQAVNAAADILMRGRV